MVIVMLHGPRGEDGTIQGLLELADIPYVGAGVLASAIGMDKVAMKDMFRAHGLPVVDYLAGGRHDWEREPDDGASRRGPPHRLPLLRQARQSRLERRHQQGEVAGGRCPPRSSEAARHDRRLLVERAVRGARGGGGGARQ